MRLQKFSHCLPKFVLKKNCLWLVGNTSGWTPVDGLVKSGSTKPKYPSAVRSSVPKTGRDPMGPAAGIMPDRMPAKRIANQLMLPWSFRILTVDPVGKP
jgi:hypothetical protein